MNLNLFTYNIVNFIVIFKILNISIEAIKAINNNINIITNS